jgi:hypothetical protein
MPSLPLLLTCVKAEHPDGKHQAKQLVKQLPSWQTEGREKERGSSRRRDRTSKGIPPRTQSFQQGPKFLPPPKSSSNYELNDDFRALIIQSLSKSSTSEHCCIGDQAFTHEPLGGISDLNHDRVQIPVFISSSQTWKSIRIQYFWVLPQTF